MKMMFAVWGSDPAALASTELRATLRRCGVERLQVNLDDAAVADAMRISSDAPISAVVGVWGGPDLYVPPVLDALADASVRVEGWLVHERRRLDAPSVADGARGAGLTNVALIRRPAELERTEWLRRWMEDHTAVAIRTQATFGYVQNVVQAALTPTAPPVDAVVEEVFPIEAITDMHAFYGSGGDDTELQRRITALMASVERIGADRDIDLVPTSQYAYDLR